MCKVLFGGYSLFASRFLLFVAGAVLAQTAVAVPNLTIEPLTWNVIGLDSNNVNVGPNRFPMGARVCNTGDAPASDVTSVFVWDSANALVNLRPGSLTEFTGAFALPTLADGSCHDFYYEVEVTRSAAAYDTVRRYHITATADSLSTVSTPTPRELYVEFLVSQARNAMNDVQVGTTIPGLTSVGAGGTMALLVGETYFIRLIGSTATNGYEQIETFINFPNTVFQVLDVETTYTADTSAHVDNPSDQLYGDGCLWENDPNSPNYRACNDVGKAGGGITVTYQVKILGVGATNPEPLSTLIYDFSGSSFHYNSDFGVSSRYAAIVDPSTLTLGKSFSPDPIQVGGVSTLTFTLSNPTPGPLSDLSFSDSFPTNLVVAAVPNVSFSGCGGLAAFSPALSGGETAVSFVDGSVAANGSCIVQVDVTASATGTFPNQTSNLFAGGIDTGSSGSDSLVASNAPPPPSPICGQTLATWNFASGFTLGSPAPYGPGTTVVASASPGAGLTSLESPQNHTVVPAGTASWGSNGGFDSSGALNTTFNDYFEFAVDTTAQTTVEMSFWARRPNGNAPEQVLVYVGIGAAPGTLHTTLGNPPGTSFPSVQNAWESSGVLTVSSGLNPAGTTFFRVYGAFASNNNPGSDLYLDDVVFTGCGTPSLPTLSKSFAPGTIAVGASSTLTFTVTNPSSTVALTGITFTDTLPAGLTVVTSGPTAVCGGSLSTTAPGTISFSGGTLAAGASCLISVPVTVNSAGPHNNTSGYVSSTETGPNTTPSGFGSATVTGIAPPALSKSFGATTVLTGATTSLAFTIENPNESTALTGITFTDPLPGGITVATSGPTATCGGSLSTSAPGNITLTGASLAGGASCTFSVTVTGSSAGTHNNTTGAVSSTNGGTGNAASATLVVRAATPGIRLLKRVGPTSGGAWGAFQASAAGDEVYYQLTIENVGDVPLSPVDVTDPLVDVSSCSWPATLPVADALDNDHIASCVVGPLGAAVGSHPNTAEATGTFSGNNVTDQSSATYATTGLSLTKSADQASFTTAGETLTYNYLVDNTGAAPLEGPVTIADSLIATVNCPAVTTVGDGDNFLEPGEMLTCTASYLTTATDVTNGSVTNLATANIDEVDSNEDQVTVPQLTPTAGISLSKDPAAQTVVTGGTASFTLVVDNTGTVDLTNVILTDGLCTTLSGPSGDDGDFVLEPLEIWTYSCTVTPVSADFTNTASVVGTPPTGPAVSVTDSATVDVVSPAIDVVKTATTATVPPGGTALFTIEATNIGDVDLENVTVDDPLCTTITGPGGDDGDAVLEVGETWVYQCEIENVTEDLINTATVQGETGGTFVVQVSGSSSASVGVGAEIPTLGELGLLFLALALAVVALVRLRR